MDVSFLRRSSVRLIIRRVKMKRIVVLLLFFICSIEFSSSCSVRCLNQTEHVLKPPPIFINDSDHDAFVLFSVNCSQTSEVKFVNVSISIENLQTIEIREHFPMDFLISDNLTFHLTVHGQFLGYSQLFLHFEYFDENRTKLNFTNELQLDFAVKRKSTILDTIFTVIVIILVCIGTFLIGCRLNSQNLITNIRRPIPILIGLSSQFLFLPLLAFGLAKLFHLDSSTSIGLLATGSSPGGGASNMYTAMFAGDVDLSASMTFTSTILAFATFPLWILLLGRDFINTHNVHFPWENMFTTLISLVLPAAIGLILRWQKATIADRLTKYLRMLTIVFILYILTFGIYTNLYIFKLIHLRTFFASALIPYSGFLIGFLLSIITQQNRQKLIAIFIESGLQNTGVAIFFLRLSLPQPDSDLAIVVPIFVAIAIPIPLLIIHTSLFISRRCQKRNETITIDPNEYEQLPNNDLDE